MEALTLPDWPGVIDVSHKTDDETQSYQYTFSSHASEYISVDEYLETSKINSENCGTARVVFGPPISV